MRKLEWPVRNKHFVLFRYDRPIRDPEMPWQGLDPAFRARHFGRSRYDAVVRTSNGAFCTEAAVCDTKYFGKF